MCCLGTLSVGIYLCIYTHTCAGWQVELYVGVCISINCLAVPLEPIIDMNR